MAENYDPYYAGQYDYDYDPYAGYDSGYSDLPYSETPPPPDTDWVDPVKVNRTYLKKIQRSCIKEGFEGLREGGLYLLEVLTRRVALKKDLVNSLRSNPDSTVKTEEPFKVYVKFLNFPFLEIKDVDDNGSTKEGRTGSVDSGREMFTKLFQEVFTTTTGRQDSLTVDSEDLEQSQGEFKGSKSDQSGSVNVVAEGTTGGEKTPEPEQENETFIVMKGKSVMVPMSGLSMVQSLQQHPLVVKVCPPGDSEESDILGACSVHSPCSFSRAILLSCQDDNLLPCLGVSSGVHDLTDAVGQTVGTVELNVTLTCFGKGVVNCIIDHDFEHTFLLKRLKAKHVVEDDFLSVNPRLAQEIMDMGIFYPEFRTSSQVLADCVDGVMVPFSDEERKRALGSADCEWFRMLDKARPPPSEVSEDSQEILERLQLEKARVLMKQRQICRDFWRRGTSVRDSLGERLREVRILRDTEESISLSEKTSEDEPEDPQTQTGMVFTETNNPFQEAARGSDKTNEDLSPGDNNKNKPPKKTKKSV